MTHAMPYGTAIQQAVASGDLQKMRAAAEAAEEHLRQHGDVAGSLAALKIEIAKAEAKAGGQAALHPVPPYGPAIQQAIAGGDLARMKETAASAQAFLAQSGNVGAALEALRVEIAKLEAKK